MPRIDDEYEDTSDDGYDAAKDLWLTDGVPYNDKTREIAQEELRMQREAEGR
jgi:hypothetical protein